MGPKAGFFRLIDLRSAWTFSLMAFSIVVRAQDDIDSALLQGMPDIHDTAEQPAQSDGPAISKNKLTKDTDDLPVPGSQLEINQFDKAMNLVFGQFESGKITGSGPEYLRGNFLQGLRYMSQRGREYLDQLQPGERKDLMAKVALIIDENSAPVRIIDPSGSGSSGRSSDNSLTIARIERGAGQFAVKERNLADMGIDTPSAWKIGERVPGQEFATYSLLSSAETNLSKVMSRLGAGSEARADQISSGMQYRKYSSEDLFSLTAASSRDKSERTLSPSERASAIDGFADQAMQGLGIANASGVIDLTKSAVALGLPPGLREVANAAFQQIAKADALGVSTRTADQKVDSLVGLANNNKFQDYISHTLSKGDLTSFNYNTTAAEVLNDLKSIAKSLPEKFKNMINDKISGKENSPENTSSVLAGSPSASSTTAKMSGKSNAEDAAQTATPLAAPPSPKGVFSGNYGVAKSAPSVKTADDAVAAPKVFGVGTLIPMDAANWIELARFLTTEDALRMAVEKGVSAPLLLQGRKDLELLLAQLRSQGSLDLMSLVKLPLGLSPEMLAKKSDDIAIKSLREFVVLRPNDKAPVRGSKVVLTADSPYSLGYVQAEASKVLKDYVTRALGPDFSTEASMLYRFQLLNGLTSKASTQEVWGFYDARSFELLKRSQGSLFMARSMLNFTQPNSALAYLYGYAQKEIGVRNQLAQERAIKEGQSPRKPASTNP